MEKQKINLKFGIIVGLILMAAFSRLLPHPPNFTPVGGMALFGAAYFSKKIWAFLLPMLALWVSNLVLDNLLYGQFYDGFQWFSNPGVFVAFCAIVIFGFSSLQKIRLPNLLFSSLGASLIFFLISNFESWLTLPFYAKNWAGLMACYAAGVPYFWNTLAGDLFYVGVLFSVFYWVQKTVFKPSAV